MNYKEMLSEYAPAMSAAEIDGEVARIAALAPRNENTDVWKLCYSAIDLTSLNATDSDRSINEFVTKAVQFGIDYPHIPNVASICVYPSFVDVVGLALGNSGIAITSVGAGFPSSQTFIEVKMLEVAMAAENGADEIDVVITIGEMLEGEYDRMASTLQTLRDELGEDTVLKVIIESGALKTPQLIREASLLAMFSGADFVKTSTGKIDVAATPEAAVTICSAIRDYYKKTGRKIGFKAAGGVRNAKDSAFYYTIVEEILGPDWLTPRLFRIGASSLANSLISAIEGREIKYF